MKTLGEIQQKLRAQMDQIGLAFKFVGMNAEEAAKVLNRFNAGLSIILPKGASLEPIEISPLLMDNNERPKRQVRF